MSIKRRLLPPRFGGMVAVAVAGWLAGASPAWAQRGKDGAGVITAAAPGAVVNAYTSLTADAAAGTTTLTVTNSALTDAAFGAALATGDLVMVIQHQGATINPANSAFYGAITSYNNAGNYELVEVRSVPSATSIVVACALQKSYTATGKTQVVRVPRYASLTLNANTSITTPAWNGTTGGIVALEVQGDVTLNTGATIDVSGKGFRGGVLTRRPNNNVNGAIGFAYPTVENGAEKGESIAGFQSDYDALGGRFGRGAPANGGGGGNNHNAGGGGGANVSAIGWTGQGNPDGSGTYSMAWDLERNTTPAYGGTNTSLAGTTSGGGGRGGYSFSQQLRDPYTVAPGTPPTIVFGTVVNTAWAGDYRRITSGLGGRPLDVSNGRLFFGGGGGAGDENDGGGTAGAIGGGLIYVVASGSIAPAGSTAGPSLLANGAGVSAISGTDAAGGGGGGGTIVLNVAGTVAAGITASAVGGIGGSQTNLGNDEAEGPGGGGGGGYVAYTAGSPNTLVTGGANGITGAKAMNNFPTTKNFPPNGATIGGSGTTSTFTYNAQCLVTADVQTILNGPSAITLGQAITYTLQTTNLSPDITATNVQPTLTLPTGATNVVLPPGATRVGDVVTFALISVLAPGTANKITNVVSYTPTATGTVTAAAANGAGSPDPALANNNGSANNAIVNTVITAPLPVELTDFTATAVKNADAVLAWHTASEKNNDHFEVERSLAGAEFVRIGQVKGQGSKSSPTAYALTDAGIGPKAQGLVYYRLKQVDTDGMHTYSPVRAVAFVDAAPLAPAIGLFPNPAGTTVQLDLTQLPAGTYQVRLLDLTGRQVLTARLPTGQLHTLDLRALPSGAYMLLVNGQHEGRTVRLAQRLLKE